MLAEMCLIPLIAIALSLHRHLSSVKNVEDRRRPVIKPMGNLQIEKSNDARGSGVDATDGTARDQEPKSIP